MAVLVYTENWDGKFKKLSFELVSYATGIASMTNDSVVAVTIGHVDEKELSQLARYGASRIITVSDERLKDLDNQAYARAIAEVVEKEKAGILVFSHNNAGKAIAPRVAVLLKAGVAACVSSLPASIQPFVIMKKTYSGKAYGAVNILSEKKIVTLAQNSYEIKEQPVTPVMETFTPSLAGVTIKTKVVDVQKQTGKVLLTDAEIVVSGGRGMKSPDNWKPIEELAALLGGATACTRPVSDEGWRPHEEHTGQTGKIIAPNLYIAVGISGATQHIAGISGSKYIVAINNDKSAPIFEVAQYGIVGDALKVLPALVEAVKEVKSR